MCASFVTPIIGLEIWGEWRSFNRQERAPGSIKTSKGNIGLGRVKFG